MCAHPLYGDIPLVEVSVTLPDGSVHRSYGWDPDHRPPLPEGAVRADLRKQPICGYGTPRYYYVDQRRRCVQCGVDFVFSGAEQKHWHETLQFNLASVAIRCVACRRRRRTDRAVLAAVDEAKRAARAAPGDAAARLAVAEAIVELHARLGRGDLDEAIAAARGARALHDERAPGVLAASHYWEALAQAAAGRAGKARAGMEACVAATQDPGGKRLRRQARAWLEQHG